VSTLVILFSGLNVQHDANHGAISRNPRINRVLGATQNWIGGSAIAWVHQHVVQHHIHTNDLEKDPDIAGNPYLRLNPNQKLMEFHIIQHIYFFVLLALYGFAVVIQSLGSYF
jgi:fatty acid desaturase (delta-4 desaturase)